MKNKTKKGICRGKKEREKGREKINKVKKKHIKRENAEVKKSRKRKREISE